VGASADEVLGEQVHHFVLEHADPQHHGEKLGSVIGRTWLQGSA
jgi:hypothetical protein